MTELMLRLVKDGKIVGYRHMTKCSQSCEKKIADDCDKNPLKSFNLDSVNEKPSNANNIGQKQTPFDSFDLGIKVGDEWWFEGDILGDDISAEGTLWWDKERYFWTVGVVGEFEESHGLWMLMKKVKLERIGTVYDKGEK